MKGNCILSDVFSASIEIFMFLSFIFKCDVPHLLFLNVEPSLHIKYESHLVWIGGLFCKSLMVLFHSKCLICLICLLFERERARERERKNTWECDILHWFTFQMLGQMGGQNSVWVSHDSSSTWAITWCHLKYTLAGSWIVSGARVQTWALWWGRGHPR